MSSPTKGKSAPSERPSPSGASAALGGSSGSGQLVAPDPESPEKPAKPAGRNDGRPRVTAAARSDKGRVRPDNQDNFVVMPLEVKTPAECNLPSNLIVAQDTRYVIGNRGLAMAVFDGMGGVAGGQWAASEAARVVGLHLFEHRREIKCDGKPGREPERILEEALKLANERIHKHGSEKPEWMGMGSTSTTAWVLGRRLIIGQVGDSRAYLFCNGELTQITRDQTLVNALCAAGVLNPEQAAVHPRRTELLECLGPSPEVRPELYEITLPAKCRLLLCTDGLHGPLGNERLEELLALPKLPGEVCKQLIETANTRGGHDNITAVVADFDVPGGPDKPVVKRLTPNDLLLGYLDDTTPPEEPVLELEPMAEEPEESPGSSMPWWMWAILGGLVSLVVLFSLLLLNEMSV